MCEEIAKEQQSMVNEMERKRLEIESNEQIAREKLASEETIAYAKIESEREVKLEIAKIQAKSKPSE